MLVGQCVAFEAGSQQDVLVVHRHEAERPRGSHVELLERLEALSEVVPQVHSGEGEVAAQNEVLAWPHRERIHRHRAPGGKSLDLYEALPFPAQDLGVADEAREAKVKNFPHPEVLHHLHIGQLRDLGEEGELLLAPVPLVNHRRLRGAGQDEVRLSSDIQELHVGVPMPGVEGLVGVETVAVPVVNAGGAGLGAVCHDKVPVSVQLEGVHEVGLPHTGGVDVLDLHEALRVLFPPETTEEVGVVFLKLLSDLVVKAELWPVSLAQTLKALNLLPILPPSTVKNIDHVRKRTSGVVSKSQAKIF